MHELDHIVVNVSDVEFALAWYTERLGLTPERVDAWRAGDVPFPSVRVNERCVIDLMHLARTGHNVDHFCLVVDRADVESVATDPHFDRIEGPVQRWGARGMATSVYVSDPDGNTVELRAYD